MATVGGHQCRHRGLHVGGIATPRHAPPPLGGGGEVVEHLPGQPAQQVPLVLEVDVEAGARDAGLGGQPVDAELGEAGTVGHQPFGGVEQLALDLPTSFLPAGLRLAGHRWHAGSVDRVPAC
jgi:hypothetical protein